jgi:hypothetical protein
MWITEGCDRGLFFLGEMEATARWKLEQARRSNTEEAKKEGSKIPLLGRTTFLVKRIVRLVLLPALEADKLLAETASFDVLLAEVSHALRALPVSCSRTAFDGAFHISNATSAAQKQSMTISNDSSASS